METVWEKIINAIKDLMGAPTISDDDMMEVLEKEAAGTGLKWKESVIDFLKLLKIDSSAENRSALAEELNIASEFRLGSAGGNEALRVAIFKMLKNNGGNVPAELLD